MKTKQFLPLVLIGFCVLPAVFAENDENDLLGMSLNDVFSIYGTPDKVFAVRGNETWQDDVVFVYAEQKTDIYIYKDRVWQAGLSSALGVKVGDKKAALLLAVSGEPSLTVSDVGDFVLLQDKKSVYPRYFRFNFNASGAISAIFVYRADT
jgi:hypothetical protein